MGLPPQDILERLRRLESPGMRPVTTWSAVTMIDPWVPSVPGRSQPMACKDPSGLVTMRGHLAGGAQGSVMCVLPLGMRPIVPHRFSVAGSSAVSIVEVVSDGSLILVIGSGDLVDFSGVCFRV